MRYVITVEWCKNGTRGVFCTQDGGAFLKEGEPHTEQEMHDILDVFWLVLHPRSEEFGPALRANTWRPLAEYNGKFGIAFYVKPGQPVPEVGRPGHMPSIVEAMNDG